jgi:thiol-disulfide isomerase/thioredoxin
MLKRLVYSTGAILSIAGALLLIANAGLPERAQFTGQVIPGQLPVAPEIAAVAPSFEIPSLANGSLRLSDLRGNPLVINFWATWCEPCRVEMPTLQKVYESYQNQGLRILAVNLGEPANAVSNWVQTLGLTFDVLLDQDGHTAALYHLRGQPSTYIVSPDGIIVQIFYGPVDETSLRNTLAPYFTT